jgi:hypothetical protein
MPARYIARLGFVIDTVNGRTVATCYRYDDASRIASLLNEKEGF